MTLWMAVTSHSIVATNEVSNTKTPGKSFNETLRSKLYSFTSYKSSDFNVSLSSEIDRNDYGGTTS